MNIKPAKLTSTQRRALNLTITLLITKQGGIKRPKGWAATQGGSLAFCLGVQMEICMKNEDSVKECFNFLSPESIQKYLPFHLKADVQLERSILSKMV